MITDICFTKASGAGNDFIIIDNRSDFLPADIPALARSLCSRYFGIGADGLLLLETSSSAHFTMKYYNSDGSYGGMCGNGGRCLARYAFLKGIAPASMSFDSLDFCYHAEVKDARIALSLRDPTDFRSEDKLSADEWCQRYFYVNTGSPHVVCFVEDIRQVPVERLGRMIRQAPAYMPDGTNVNFVDIKGDNSINVRTYERGVESETLACGTGSVASGVIAHLQRGLPFPVTVNVKSGESLQVSATIENGTVKRPVLEGSAHMLFSGSLLYNDETRSIVERSGEELERT